MPTALDHLLVFVFAVAWPLYVTFIDMPRYRRMVAAGEPIDLIKDYGITMAIQWTLALLAVLVWARSGRSFADLGFRVPGGWPFWITLGLASAAVVGLAMQLRVVKGSAAAREQIRSQVKPFGFFLPKRPAEMRLFHAVSITAGVCEELLFRGYLIWYLEQFIGLAGAIVGSTLVFGLAHAYQGRAGVVKSALAGACMAGLFVPTRSLLVPVVVHAVADILGGLTTYEALKEEREVSAAA